jgi:hypothetical protein
MQDEQVVNSERQQQMTNSVSVDLCRVASVDLCRVGSVSGHEDV